jgi:hypothetical protein
LGRLEARALALREQLQPLRKTCYELLEQGARSRHPEDRPLLRRAARGAKRRCGRSAKLPGFTPTNNDAARAMRGLLAAAVRGHRVRALATGAAPSVLTFASAIARVFIGFEITTRATLASMARVLALFLARGLHRGMGRREDYDAYRTGSGGASARRVGPRSRVPAGSLGDRCPATLDSAISARGADHARSGRTE